MADHFVSNIPSAVSHRFAARVELSEEPPAKKRVISLFRPAKPFHDCNRQYKTNARSPAFFWLGHRELIVMITYPHRSSFATRCPFFFVFCFFVMLERVCSIGMSPNLLVREIMRCHPTSTSATRERAMSGPNIQGREDLKPPVARKNVPVRRIVFFLHSPTPRCAFVEKPAASHPTCARRVPAVYMGT